MGYHKCERCEGVGQIRVPNTPIWFWWRAWVKCSDCNGDGHMRPPKYVKLSEYQESVK